MSESKQQFQDHSLELLEENSSLTSTDELISAILTAAGLQKDNSTDSSEAQWEAIAQALSLSDNYRVLRRFKHRSRYHETDITSKTRTALFVDVETTGLSHLNDKIIEFAAVPFNYCMQTGRIFEVMDSVVFLEDPGMPISDGVRALTGITDEMVAGKKIDDAAVEDVVKSASLIIAHNAGFDRKFLELRLPCFKAKHWACSLSDVPWEKYNCSARKLEYLLYRSCGEFFDGHRADEDCFAGVHVLATQLPDGHYPMQFLLQSARQTTMRIWAVNASIELKDLLKERSYRWNGSAGKGRPRAWYRDISIEDFDAEKEWLEKEIYRGHNEYRVQKITSQDRYSDRA